ncbi:nuclear transport factor 2 family protein [Nocardioides sp. YIM 152588]|uniref:nuclear transport factor 2 family protein n=1 Tax=Nocardioides sp. YIM 152588 TaxID=3158259 RepID=UPI0032E3C7E4
MSSVLERLTRAQNDHDAVSFASYFTEGYRSEQPVHPGRAFTGREQVRENWTSVFAGVPDFRSELVASCRDGDVEWGEVHWWGHHVDGAVFEMRGVIIATIRDDRIAKARLFVDAVERSGSDIEAAVEQSYRPPPAEE